MEGRALLPSRIGLIFSYVICINTCAFLRNSFKIIMWYVFRQFYQSYELILFSNIIAYSIMFWCGCLAGYLINKHIILHASLAVALGVVFTYLLSGLNPNQYGLLFQGTLTGAILGGMGGGCTQIVSRLKHSRKKA